MRFDISNKYAKFIWQASHSSDIGPFFLDTFAYIRILTGNSQAPYIATKVFDNSTPFKKKANLTKFSLCQFERGFISLPFSKTFEKNSSSNRNGKIFNISNILYLYILLFILKPINLIDTTWLRKRRIKQKGFHSLIIFIAKHKPYLLDKCKALPCHYWNQ